MYAITRSQERIRLIYRRYPVFVDLYVPIYSSLNSSHLSKQVQIKYNIPLC